MAFALRNPYRRRAQRTERQVADQQAAAETTPPPRTRIAAARGAWAVGSALLALARLVRLVVGIVVAVIVVAIVLRLLSANPANSIVKDIHDVAKALVGPFKNVFSIKNAKASLAVNWGLAAVVYMIVGGLIAGLIARAAPRGVAPSERVA